MDSKNQIEVWLRKLEQESWQLELLVSGFTIFLLQTSYQAVTVYSDNFEFHFESGSLFFNIFFLLLYILSTCVLVLIVNLVLHLLFRGFWIGAIGLRSVGSSIDYERLNYNQFFTTKLKSGVVSMDDLIVKLDRVCSVIFSFTFLVIFLFLSLFLFVFILFLCQTGLQFAVDISPSWLAPGVQVISTGITIGLLLMGIAYLVDSLSLGLLKKSRRLRPLYYPVYKILNTITLSFLYRTIYYNIITKFPVKYTRLVLTVYLLIIFFIPFVGADDYRYYPDNVPENSVFSEYYDDQRAEDMFIGKASIPSMTISDSYISLFVRYDVSDNSALSTHCPEFTPAKKGGLKHGIEFTSGGLRLSTPSVDEPHPEKALNCLLDFYTIQIDKQPADAVRAYFYTHPNNQEKGVMFLINAERMTKGPHEIVLSKQILQDSLLQTEDYANIQFWKE